MQTLPEQPKENRKQKLIAAGAIVAILFSAAWVYWFEFGTSRQNVRLHRAVGEVMAEQTSHVVGHAGKVVLVTVGGSAAPELKLQIDAFQKELKRLGQITIKDTVVLDAADNAKYQPGAGLSAKHFLKIVRKHPTAAAIVSFVGAPELTDVELVQMKTVPRLIAETHSPEKLMNLLDKKILLAAIVPRFEFPAPGPRKPETSRQWFDRYFQILSPETGLVKSDDLP
jgi:hypothetical protein